MKRSGEKKWILKELLYKYVPKKIIDRPKIRFGVPIDEWLLDPLSEWAEHLLSKQQIQTSGIFNE